MLFLSTKQTVNSLRKITDRYLSFLYLGKTFEKILFNNLYHYLITNNLISDKQAAFKKNDSTVNQLLYICHEIFLSFDANPPEEVRAVLLDISKTFDKVWTIVTKESYEMESWCPTGICSMALNVFTLY